MSYSAPPPPPPAGGQPPANNLVLAILSIFCCWPLAIPAIVFASQVNSKWAQGDVAGAQDAAAKAKKFATWAIIAGVVLTILYIILIAAGVATTDA